MPSLTYSFTANVSKGPSVSAGAKIDLEAAEEIEVTVPAETDVTVSVQPGSGGQFMVITADRYEDLSYEVDGSGADVTFDGPHIFIGSGAVQLLGTTQNDIEFKNGGAEDVNVYILVGRDATP